MHLELFASVHHVFLALVGTQPWNVFQQAGIVILPCQCGTSELHPAIAVVWEQGL
jgi:hypothetical protein